jgi:hypothetical protein
LVIHFPTRLDPTLFSSASFSKSFHFSINQVLFLCVQLFLLFLFSTEFVDYDILATFIQHLLYYFFKTFSQMTTFTSVWW